MTDRNIIPDRTGKFILVFDCERYSTKEMALERAKEINLLPRDNLQIFEVKEDVPVPPRTRRV